MGTMIFRSERLGTAGRAGACALALLLAAAATSPLGAQEEAQGPPPESDADTMQVAEAAQDGSGRHEVDEGDTLWDLAGRYLADPFSWPRIFELNQDVVEDPHWIYPGEVLRLPGAETAADVTGVEVARRGDVAPDTAERAERPRRAPGEDPFAGPSIFDRNPSQRVTTGGFSVEAAERGSLVTASVFFSAGFLADYGTVRPRGRLARVIRENPLGLEIPPSARIGDRVMLSLDGISAAPGDTLQAVREGRGVGGGLSVVHPQGLVEIQKVSGDSARAAVIGVFGSLQAGDDVIPIESYTVGDLRRLRSTDDGLRAGVRALAVDQPLVATGDIVFLDVGSSSGVTVGDEFSVFSTSVADPAAAEPEDRLGVVRVVRVRGSTSTARVTDLRDLGIGVGAKGLRVRRPVQTGR